MKNLGYKSVNPAELDEFTKVTLKMELLTLRIDWSTAATANQHLERFKLFKSQIGWFGYWFLNTVWMLFAKSKPNEFKVQNRLQAQSEHVKVFKRKYESYEWIPCNTFNQSVTRYNKKFKNSVKNLMVVSFRNQLQR